MLNYLHINPSLQKDLKHVLVTYVRNHERFGAAR